MSERLFNGEINKKDLWVMAMFIADIYTVRKDIYGALDADTIEKREAVKIIIRDNDGDRGAAAIVFEGKELYSCNWNLTGDFGGAGCYTKVGYDLMKAYEKRGVPDGVE